MKHLPLLLVLTSCQASVPNADDLVTQYWGSLPPTEATPSRAAERRTSREPATRASGSAWTLDDILVRIRRANPNLATARARVASANAAHEEAYSYYYPSLTASQGYLRTDNPATAFGLLLDQQRLTLGPTFDSTPGSTDNWRTELRLDVELFSPGRTDRYRAAGAGARAAELLRVAIERRLLNAGVQAWLGLRAASELRRVKQRTITVVAERLAKTGIREREGAALRADVLRLEVRLAAVKQDAQHAELTVRQGESRLQALMGLHGDERIRLADEQPLVGRGVPLQLDRAIVHARTHRLDVRAKAESLRAREHLTNSAEAGYLPRLVVFGAYDIDGSDLSLDLDLDSYAVGMAMEWRISGQTGSRIRRAQAERDRARAELRAIATEITREVTDALAELDVAARSNEFANSAASSAEEAYRIVAAAQDAGGATVTDLLEAENARDDAAAREVVARAALDIARVRLAAAVGDVR